jgi:hypothetical protein
MAKPAFLQKYLDANELKPSSWCHMNEAENERVFKAAFDTTHTREEAIIMAEFWKKNYYDAMHRYEDITRPFNGVNDADRTAALNEPLMRLRINLAEAYCTTPSMEYMAARRVLQEKFPE